MKELRLGVKPGVGPVLKIMKDDADDPFTTPNDEMSKFIFNSENEQVGYIRDMFIFQPDFVTYPSNSSAGADGVGIGTPLFYYLYPAGSTYETCKAIVVSLRNDGKEFQRWRLKKGWFLEKYGINFVPITELRDYTPTGVYSGPYVNTDVGHVSGNGFAESVSASTLQCNCAVEPYWDGSNWHCSNVDGVGAYVGYMSGPIGGPYSSRIVTVFDLPALTDALPDYSGTASSGQEVIRIDQAGGGKARIALPGYTVANPDPNRYVLHEDKIPVKVVAAGELLLPHDGTATITTTMPMPEDVFCYMDFHAKRSTQTEFYNPPFFNSPDEDQTLGFTYQVNASNNRQIDLTNTSRFAISIRYVVYANSSQAPTTGGKNILWNGNDGVTDFTQIKRPGSHDTNWNLNDIMVDTRAVYLPRLAEGFIAVGDFEHTTSGDYRGNRYQTITVDNPDNMLLMVKCGIIFPGASRSDFYYDAVANPVAEWNSHRVGVGTGDNAGKIDSTSSWARIYPDNVTIDFWMRSGSVRLVVGDAINYVSSAAGLRYYVFGIPADL